MPVSEDIRDMLARRCRAERRRRSDSTAKAPCKWEAETLRDPRSPDEYFTRYSAWLFIAEQIEAGVEIYCIDLRYPPGKKGYYFVVPGIAPVAEIYIKLQLMSEDVLCRSFHERPARVNDDATRGRKMKPLSFLRSGPTCASRNCEYCDTANTVDRIVSLRSFVYGGRRRRDYS